MSLEIEINNKIQKKAIRIMTNSNYNAHTNPLYIEHGILPYDLLIKQSQLLFMHSIAYEYAPTSITGVWIKNADRDPNLHLRNAIDYYLIHPLSCFCNSVILATRIQTIILINI
jgi:hypothetical protein